MEKFFVKKPTKDSALAWVEVHDLHPITHQGRAALNAARKGMMQEPDVAPEANQRSAVSCRGTECNRIEDSGQSLRYLSDWTGHLEFIRRCNDDRGHYASPGKDGNSARIEEIERLRGVFEPKCSLRRLHAWYLIIDVLLPLCETEAHFDICATIA